MPDWRAAIRERLATIQLSGAREAEILEELEGHLDQRYEELLAAGMSPDRATKLSLDELESGGALAAGLQRCRSGSAIEQASIGARGGRGLMTGVWHDGKLALRMIWLKPGFSAMVIGMLALGVAGNAAIFSIFNGLFLRPLPFAHPERLVDVDETAPEWNLKFVGVSNIDAYDWMEANKSFDGMAFFSQGGENLSAASGTAQRIRAARVTWPLLDVLGLKPVLGRNFLPEEDRPGGAKVAILGYDLWQRLFHGDRNVLGQALKLDEQPYTVVGVLPREAVLPPDAELWTPLAADPKAAGSYYLSGVGRLKPGISIAQAKADLMRVHKGAIQSGRKVNEVTSPVLMPLRDRYLGDFRAVTHILLGAVGVVLLIACVNIAALMLVRSEARAREIAIRAAVGASRVRVVRQLLSESFLLAGVGGALGVALGAAGLRALVSLMPDDLPRWVRFDLDGRFALFSVAVTGAAALLFGLAPALHSAGLDADGLLRETGRSTLTRGKRGVLSALVVCEIALALILLIGSGLLLQAFRKVLNVNPGFRAENVLTWTLRLPDATYPKAEQRLAFFQRLVDRLKTLPGSLSVSAASNVPLDGHSGYFLIGEGATPRDAKDRNPVVLHIVALAGYIRAMGMTLIAGREFDERDEQAGAPKVVLINEALAKFLWGTTDVVGRRVRYQGNRTEWMQVAGVVRNVWHYGLDGEMRPCVFVPFSVTPQQAMTLAVRTSMDPHLAVAPAREAIRAMDPDLPMFNIRTMTERINRSLWVRRAYSWLFAVFALVAMLLAAAGVYGVISFAVSRRTREIGIRIALGARPEQVMRGVLGSGMLLVAAGVALGVAASLLSVNLLSALLFGVDKRDPAIYTAVIVGLSLIGGLANYFPARRAARVAPVQALRAE